MGVPLTSIKVEMKGFVAVICAGAMVALVTSIGAENKCRNMGIVRDNVCEKQPEFCEAVEHRFRQLCQADGKKLAGNSLEHAGPARKLLFLGSMLKNALEKMRKIKNCPFWEAPGKKK